MISNDVNEIRVLYRTNRGYALLRATPTVPIIRAASKHTKHSALLRSLIRLAAPHESIDAQLLDPELSKFSPPSLRAALPYVRFHRCPNREGTVADWLLRIQNFSVFRRTLTTYDVEELLRALTNTESAQLLSSRWSALSDADIFAAHISTALSFRPKALLLDGHASNGALEKRILNLTNRLRIPVIWDGCSRRMVNSVHGVTFISPMIRRRDPLQKRTTSCLNMVQRCSWRTRIQTMSSGLFRWFAIIGAAVGVEASGLDVRGAASAFIREYSTNNGAVDIPWWRIATLSLVLSFVVAVSSFFELGIGTRLVVAASRCFVQLGLLGLVLVPIIKGNNPIIVLGYLTLMILVAGLEASNRPPYVYPELFGICLLSIFCAVLIIGTFVFSIVVGTGLDAQYIIPILGMLMGSCLSGISVGVSSVVNNVVSSTDNIEALLALGATRWEATRDVVKNAVLLGLTPCLNLMSVTGLVSIPGMMTGQIIAGTSPGLAARYQVVIMYSVAGCTCASVMSSVLGTVACVTDKVHRVRVERLVEREKAKKVMEVVAENVAKWIRPSREMIALPTVPVEDGTNYGSINVEESEGMTVATPKN